MARVKSPLCHPLLLDSRSVSDDESVLNPPPAKIPRRVALPSASKSTKSSSQNRPVPRFGSLRVLAGGVAALAFLTLCSLGTLIHSPTEAPLFSIRAKVLLAEPWEGCGQESDVVVIKAVASTDPKIWKVRCPNGVRVLIPETSLRPMTFHPTSEWQVLPPGTPAPMGCEFKTVLGRGTEVRLSAIRG